MRKNGFTLIELLAVIVILAIIALIAVPVIVNIITDSKASSEKESIKIYLDTVEKAITRRMFAKPSFNPTECTISGNKEITCGTEEIEIDIKGEVPSEGTIKFGNGMIIEGINLKLNGLYYQVTDGKVSEGTVEKVVSYSDYITLVSDADHDGKVSIGDEYTYKVNATDTFYFYVLSIKGDKVNLIMDSNICGSATDANASTNGQLATNDSLCTIAWHSGAKNNNYGPDTAMQGLYNATKNWTNVPDMNLSGENAYTDENNKTDNTKGYTGITTENGVATITGKNNATNTTIGTREKPLKARLPREYEVTSEDAGCHVWSSNSDYGACNYWLVKNLYYDTNFGSYCSECVSKYSGNQTNGITNISGYWLLSSIPGSSNHARFVYYYGNVSNTSTSNASDIGLRAVITVSKSDLS